jgi:hypothetical protein
MGRSPKILFMPLENFSMNGQQSCHGQRVCVLVCIESFVDELSSNDLIEMMRLRRDDKGGFIQKGFVVWCKWGLGMLSLKKHESQ